MMAEPQAMPVNGSGGEPHLNGMQNGYASSTEKHHSSSSGHKSSSKDKHRDKDREHKSSSSKHHSSSGSSKDKDRHSSSSKSHGSSSSSHHKSSSKDKDKSDKDKHRSDRDKERSSDKHRSGESSKDKDRERSDKHKSSSSSDKDKKHSSSSSSKDHKSSSSSSSKDKSLSSSSRDKDRDRSDKDKHRSSSSKHHSSSSKDKHSSSSKDKDKSSHSSSRDKDRHEKSQKIKEEEDIKPRVNFEEDVHIKDEPQTQQSMSWNNRDQDDDEDEEMPHVANNTASSCDYSMSQFKDESISQVKSEPEEEDQREPQNSDDDVPLTARKSNKRKSYASESEEEIPLSKRKSQKAKKVKKESDYENDDAYSEEEVKPKKKKTKVKKESDYENDYSEEEVKPKKKKVKTKVKEEVKTEASPTKRKKKQEDEPEVWKWWEEEKKNDGTKWKYLEHKGPLFAPPYEPLPKGVIFKYDGKEMSLSEEAEEVAGFYAKMLDHDYTTKGSFNENFFGDWRKVMTDKEKSIIKDLKKCDFKSMHAFFMAQAEKNRNKSKEEKADLKKKNEEIQKEYGFCTIDGHKEKIGNFRIEPPGLFRGRGEHPKMGMLKKRVLPEHVIINCSKDSKIPKPPSGHKWREVKHDNNVTWLASWTENVQGQVKYVMLNPSSKLKGEKDWQKYETARKLAKCVDKIRDNYRDEWKAKEMRIRQRAVALYFIDRLALRAGNEKDEDQADTVGCCSLRVEHVELHKEKDGKEYVVVFDFLGKDSIRYYNEVPVEKRVFKNLELFKENKKSGDDLFDRLNTQTLNEYLRELMPNLTAKVFRTFNASSTLQNQLKELTDGDASIEEKILAYNRANRAVAVLCNHQRAVPKGHQKSMDALKDKINNKREAIDEAESDLKDLNKLAKRGSVKEKLNADKKKKALQRLKEQLRKLEVQETDRDENKTIALGTSKLNYLDPRISVAWCKKHGVPIEKIYNKTQRDKFRWAIDMATVDYVF